ncbi:dihydroorotase [Pseudomonas gingeri]|uniref:dihydroorotase n=1 Tax=Pseudomonas gingeri TaxID=117681 RepID=UPI0015A3EFAB|nr:dihydroorotase [Pseudomonas gingeri]NVZ63132.1 dihydroorotase [Pseudomonas gingeri]NVZ78751.1 dihydroorotase [Pseudomonas gingeri]
MSSLLIRNARVVNEGREFDADVRVLNGRIEHIAPQISNASADREIDAAGDWLLPGMIDDQVHFRDPGAPHKGSIHTESRAAVAGGITSYMDMPNTRPATLTLDALADKKRRAAINSVANYGFHFGVSNDNLDTVAALDPRQVAGVKVFMGASTGNMLVDDPRVLERLFAEVPTILLAHCEHTPTIDQRMDNLRELFGDMIPPGAHPLIRNAEACYRSSSLAVELARRHGTRLHVLHLTSERELALFENKPLSEKRITAEVCLHHLLFDDRDYPRLGNLIKCNPAIKHQSDRDALREALLSNRLDVIGSDHAPHTWEEKLRPYSEAPSGLPLVQHALPALMELVAAKVLPLTTLVAKTSHRVADLFAIPERGYLREGYWADLVLMNRQPVNRAVSNEPILYQCGWTPFVERSFRHHVGTTVVSGQIAWHAGQIHDNCQGQPLQFLR